MSVSNIIPSPAALEACRVLESRGYPAYCVGGAVRDSLMGLTAKDWDVASAATPNDVRRFFSSSVDIGSEFGTIGAVIGTGAAREMIEITTFRSDIETDGRHAVVKFTGDLEVDLARRDLTINALAFRPATDELRDPFGGAQDMSSRTIRAVGDPAMRMLEDRLRALRAIRFAARLGFEIEPATWKAIVDSAPHLTRLSSERIHQELSKTMESLDNPSLALRLWQASGAFTAVLPALDDLDEETLRQVDALPRSSEGQGVNDRFIALFSQVRKDVASKSMLSLRASTSQTSQVLTVGEAFRTFGRALSDLARLPDEGALRRIVFQVGRPALPSLLRLLEARWVQGADAGYPSPAETRSFVAAANRISVECPLALSDLAITGAYFTIKGVKGPAVGKALARLMDAVVEDPSLNSQEALSRLADREVASYSPARKL